MGKIDNAVTLEYLLEAYDQGLLTDAELYDFLLIRAEGENPAEYLDRIPPVHRLGFARAIASYPLEGTGVHYSWGFDAVPDDVVRRLQSALSKKREEGWLENTPTTLTVTTLATRNLLGKHLK